MDDHISNNLLTQFQTPLRQLIPKKSIGIISSEKDGRDGVIFYKITIKIAHDEWTIKRRFNEFWELCEHFQQQYNCGLTVPAKTFGTLSPTELEKRRSDLNDFLEVIY
jgi:PX domain